MTGCATSAAALAPAAGSGPVVEAVAVARLLFRAAQDGYDLDLGAMLDDLVQPAVRRALVRVLAEEALLQTAQVVGIDAARVFHEEHHDAPAPPPSPERWLRRVPCLPLAGLPLTDNEMRALAGTCPAGSARARPKGALHGLGSRPPFGGKRVWLP